MFDQGSSSTSNMPDEIDGDDRLGVSQKSGRTRLQSTASEETDFDLSSSMYINAADTSNMDA